MVQSFLLFLGGTSCSETEFQQKHQVVWSCSNRLRRIASVNWCVSGRKPWAKSGREQLQQILGNVIGHERNGRLSFSLRQRLRNCAGTVDEKLRDGADRAVLQGRAPRRVRTENPMVDAKKRVVLTTSVRRRLSLVTPVASSTVVVA